MSNDTTVMDETSAETEPNSEPITTEPKPTETVEYWKQKSRENEKRAKANATAAAELEEVRKANMTELERALADKETETRTAVLREFGSTRVDDNVKLAAAGRNLDVDALLDGLDRTRFMDDQGQPDVKAIRAFIDRIAPLNEDQGRIARVPTGVRTPGNPKATPAEELGAFIQNQLKSL